MINLIKAFDCIPFEHLTTSLASAGINGTTLDWFTSYLSGRSQRVKYFNVLSTPLPIQFGVPQGSILGPAFINTLLYQLPPDSCIAYADDVSVTTTGKTNAKACVAMQFLLNIVQNWTSMHGMTISAMKCFVMLISGLSANEQQLYLCSFSLPIVTSIRILVVNFTNNLS